MFGTSTWEKKPWTPGTASAGPGSISKILACGVVDNTSAAWSMLTGLAMSSAYSASPVTWTSADWCIVGWPTVVPPRTCVYCAPVGKGLWNLSAAERSLWSRPAAATASVTKPSASSRRLQST